MANTKKTPEKRSGPGRRSAEHAESTKERIEAAALEAFSDVGFDAASTRLIANRAGVNPQLITYHFGTKLGLWKAVADQTFTNLATHLGERIRGLDGVAHDERLRLMLREYVRYAAEHPQIARFMSHEGARPGLRLDWLIERHVRPIFAMFRGKSAPPGPRKHSCRRADTAVIRIHRSDHDVLPAAEFELLTGRDPCSPEIINAYTDLILSLLLPNKEN